MRILPVVLTAFLAACGPRPMPAATPTPADASRDHRKSLVWRSPSLGVQDGDSVAALKAPFESPVSVVSRTKVAVLASNCEDYFRLKAGAYSAVSEEAHSLWRSEGVRCEAIQRAASMRPGMGEPAKDLLSDAQLLRHLPATVGPSVSLDELALRKDSEAKGQAWSEYAAGARVEVQDGVAVVYEADTISRLRPLASGDIGNDGEAEVLVEAVCNGTEGTWVDIRLLVLSPVTNATGTRSYRLVESVAP